MDIDKLLPNHLNLKHSGCISDAFRWMTSINIMRLRPTPR